VEKVIVMTAWRRPKYLARVLEALRRCVGIEEYTVIICAEPGNAEVETLVRGAWVGKTTIPVLNTERLGCARNTYEAFRRGFETGDYVILVQEDDELAPDALSFFEWAGERYAGCPKVMSVSGYNFTKDWQDWSVGLYAREARVREWTSSLTLATWRDRWEWLKERWGFDVGWGPRICGLMKETGKGEVHPVISRVQNIGAEDGTHTESAAWHMRAVHNAFWAGGPTARAVFEERAREGRCRWEPDCVLGGIERDRMRLTFGVVTCVRPKEYVHKTIESMGPDVFGGENGPLTLSVGGPDSEYLARYADDPRFAVNRMTKGEASTYPPFEKLSRSTRCSLGEYRCLRKLLEGPFDFTAVFEDDLEFALGWLPWLKKTLSELVASKGSRWVLALYLPHEEVKLCYQKGMRWFETSRDRYFGSQALLFPRWAAEAMLPELLKEVMHGDGVATDMVLARMLIDKGVPLYATAPCVVQHVGDVSVGCDPKAVFFHKAGVFVPELVV
jgi:hypothetical protein